jgi:hypothetical protein
MTPLSTSTDWEELSINDMIALLNDLGFGTVRIQESAGVFTASAKLQTSLFRKPLSCHGTGLTLSESLEWLIYHAQIGASMEGRAA